MMRFRIISVLGVVAILTVGSILVHGTQLAAADQGSALALAPTWKLKDLNGKEVSSDQFKGKVLIVDFWATWCGPCLSEIPGYIELEKKYGAKGLAIVGVSLDRQSPKYVQKFARDHGMNYTIVMGDEDVVAAFGNFDAIPTTFLIDREGRIAHQKTGAMPHDQYEAIVKKVL